MKADFFKNLALGLGVSLVLLVLIELILMAAGVTPLFKRTDTSVGFAGYAPLFQKHSQLNGQEVYTTAHNKRQWFNVQSFPVTKAENVSRIFCLGGSTTYGRPYDDRTSFCGWLRLFLKEVDTSHRWEVINAGGISYASYRVARLMEELADYEPDLFIVYSGHNEFLESRTYDKLLKVPQFVRSLAVQASRSRIYSLLYDLMNKTDEVLPTEVNALLDNSVGPEDYHRDDEMRDAVLDHYQTSLLRMTQTSEYVGTRIIFVSPASNIGDFSPFKSEPSDHMSVAEINQVDSLKQMVSSAMDRAEFMHAESITRKALALDGRDPELLYQYAQALQSLNRMDEARNAFIQSRDEDICPLRALSPTHEIVADVARTTKSGFVDFVSIISKHSPNGIPGSELFLDHVHPTIEGNRLLALAVLQEMKKEGILSQNAKWDEDLVDEISMELENSLDEQTHAEALRKLSRVLTWAGKQDEAERLINLAVAMIPQDSETHVQKGILLWRDGDREAAIIHLREAERLDPMNADIHRRLGIILSELGSMQEAQIELEKAIRLDPMLADLHYDLGIVLQALGKMKQAEIAYRTAVNQDSKHAKAYNNLGVVLAKGGYIQEAYGQFEKACQLDPDYEEAANNLERARMALDQIQHKN